jgi:hypothetical protein
MMMTFLIRGGPVERGGVSPEDNPSQAKMITEARSKTRRRYKGFLSLSMDKLLLFLPLPQEIIKTQGRSHD